MSVGLLRGVDLSVDSTQIRADASPDRTVTREQLPEIAKVNRTVREYVEQVERENVIPEPEQTSDPSDSEAEGKPELRRTYRNSPPMKISTTDPEAALSSKQGTSEFAYYDNYLIDNRSCIIAGGAKPSQCRNCSHKPACTPWSTHRTLRVNSYEDVREHVRKLSQTPEYANARRARNKIEALFSELRNQIHLRKLRLRGLPRAGEQFILAATVQNIKRLVRFINQRKEPESVMA